MDALTVLPATEAQGPATYGMANLRAKTTGLPFVVFISQRAGARHDVRVKVAAGPRVQPDQIGSYQLRPFQHKDGPRLGVGGEALLRSWAALNLDVLVSYWDERIAFTEDAIDLLKRCSLPIKAIFPSQLERRLSTGGRTPEGVRRALFP